MRVQFEKNIDDFSAGQRKKTLIAKSLCEAAHIYNWDEPLNFVDLFSREQIETLIKEFSPTLIFVEHDRFFREAVATREIALTSFSLKTSA
jgi:lincosamide and streptogramin A transport system ATP-binding/permease protein